MEKQKVEKLVENYSSLSGQIGDAKNQIIDSLVALHEDLASLARLERELEAERAQGVTRQRGLAFNEPALVEHLNEHHKQLQLPAQKVWGLVNDAMTAIYQLNQSAMSGGVDELPEVFKRSDRILDFNGQR